MRNWSLKPQRSLVLDNKKSKLFWPLFSLVLLVVGGGSAFLLTSVSTDIRQQAREEAYEGGFLSEEEIKVPDNPFAGSTAAETDQYCVPN
jgi:hypothetical protein